MEGCGLFGYSETSGHIDDINEVDAAVTDIMDMQTDVEGDSQQGIDAAYVLILREYVHRVRLLTWAVGIIALVLILKEVE